MQHINKLLLLWQRINSFSEVLLTEQTLMNI